MNGAAGVEAVRMGRDAAHGMHRDRPANHPVMPAAGGVAPGDIERDGLIEGDIGKLGGDASDGRRLGTPQRSATAIGTPIVGEIALSQKLEGRHRAPPVGQACRAMKRWPDLADR